ncbi:MAG: thioredoxin family protein [Actinomycetota bacterium]|nr:thioredoxin family protein [Actinomycetota bacterium]
MAAISTILPLGTTAPSFDLPDTVTGSRVSIDHFADKKALLVMFICNNCPYVQHIRQGLVELGEDYADSELGIVAISANDPAAYPSDGPEEMAREAREFGYRFPYLYDEDQEVAKAYTAMCTPDFFLFGPERTLVYRGRFDQARPNMPEKVTGADLRAAVEAVLDDQPVSGQQFPSMGCSIKWKPGNEPDPSSVG